MNSLSDSAEEKNRYVYVKPKNSVVDIDSLDTTGSDYLDGGPEAYIAQFLALIGPEPALILSFGRSRESEIIHGNKKLYSIYWRRGASIKTLVSRLGACAKLVRYLVSFRPTKVLCWQTNIPLWVTYLFSALLNARFIVSRHTRFPNMDDPWYRQFTGSIDKWVVRKADAIICHGPYLKNETRANRVNPEKIFEFSWGFKHMLDYADAQERVPDLTEGDSKRIILFIGRIFILKGVFDLLQACIDILGDESDIKLVYIGDGPDLVRLEKEIKTKGLDDRVKALGRIRHELLNGYIRQTTVLVTPTKKKFPEGRCMATMEGLVMGVPVVAPNFGPFPYIVENGVNGLLFEPDSVNDLREKLLNILRERETYKRLKAGAKKSSSSLANPKNNFKEALEYALELHSKKSKN